LEAFQRHAAEGVHGLFFGTWLRVLPVWIYRTPLANLPVLLTSVVGYQFYEDYGHGALGLPYRPGQEEFARTIRRLARDIVLTIKAKQAMTAAGAAEAPPEEKPCVYLAETNSALRFRRARVREELLQMGVAVLPDEPIPSGDGKAFSEEVRSYLRRCALSIHLVGDQYGLVPEGETRSVVELQCDLAAERAEESRFARLVWMLGEFEPADERQKSFAAKLGRDAATRGNLQLLRTPFSGLTSHVMATLEQLKSSDPPPDEGPSAPTGVAFIDCHKNDSALAIELASLLTERRYEIRLALEGDGPLKTLSGFEEAIKQANVLIITFGVADKDWMAQRLTAAWKLAVESEAQQLKLLGVYTGAGAGAEERLKVVSSFAPLIPVFGFDRPEMLKAELDRIAEG
jgi:hypothetical protein